MRAQFSLEKFKKSDLLVWMCFVSENGIHGVNLADSFVLYELKKVKSNQSCIFACVFL